MLEIKENKVVFTSGFWRGASSIFNLFGSQNNKDYLKDIKRIRIEYGNYEKSINDVLLNNWSEVGESLREVMNEYDKEIGYTGRKRNIERSSERKRRFKTNSY